MGKICAIGALCSGCGKQLVPGILQPHWQQIKMVRKQGKMKRLTSNIEGLSARQLAQRCIGAEELSNGRERKLALGDDILMSVSSPARYVGGEVNSVMKTLTPGMVRFAMCFPDVYEIGMSHLGIQILYDMFNRYDDVWCERVYSPWLDLDKIMREKKFRCLPWNLRSR